VIIAESQRASHVSRRAETGFKPHSRPIRRQAVTLKELDQDDSSVIKRDIFRQELAKTAMLRLLEWEGVQS
jgi:hypothetical protein